MFILIGVNKTNKNTPFHIHTSKIIFVKAKSHHKTLNQTHIVCNSRLVDKNKKASTVNLYSC